PQGTERSWAGLRAYRRTAARRRRTAVAAVRRGRAGGPARALALDAGALLLDAEDPAHHLARLDGARLVPEAVVPQVAARGVAGRDRQHLLVDAPEALDP